MSDNNERFSPSDWQAGRLRLTAFPQPVDGFPEPFLDNWWEELFRVPPEKRHKDFGTGIIELNGNIEGVFTVLVATPVTFELRWQAHADPALALLGFGSLEERAHSFQDLCARWLELSSCPPLQRIGFGASLNLPVATREEGYKLLDQLLPSVDVNPGSLDFRYQINRRRLSNSMPQVEVNRISRWSVQELLMGLVDPHSESRSMGMSCSLEVDINNVMSNIAIDRACLRTLFVELLGMGVEIAEKGDIE